MKQRATAFGLTALGLVLVLVATLAIFGMPVGPSLHLIADGAFGDKFGIARSLVRFTPLLLTGLGITVAWRAGMYNIGGEGQFVIGGIFGAWAAKVLMAYHVPPPILTWAVLVACTLGGALYGAFSGWLKAKRGVNIVISTILLNFVALQLLSWVVAGPLRGVGSTLPLTDELPRAAMLYRPDHTSDLHAGVLLSIVAAGFMAYILFGTRYGFVLRLVGDNPRAARVNLVDPDRVQVWAMALSGGLCGLAGAVEYLGIAGQLSTEFSQNWGFLAIPVALLGALHPLGLLLSAGYFGALMAGTSNLARFSEGGDTLIYVIQAAAVLGLVGVRSLVGLRRSTAVEVR